MAGQEEKIRNYLKTYLKKGYSKEELRKVLIEFHYNPKIIDSVFKEIKRPELKPKERIEVSVFEDDFILDISGSMSGLSGDEQRKMVLSCFK